MRDDPAVQHPAEARRECPHLLQRNRRLVRERAAATPVLLRDGRTQQTQLAGPEPHLPVHVLLAAPALLVRRALLLEEVPRQLGEHVGVGVQPAGPVHAHASSPFAMWVTWISLLPA